MKISFKKNNLIFSKYECIVINTYLRHFCQVLSGYWEALMGGEGLRFADFI
jgi:hypothetical protein